MNARNLGSIALAALCAAGPAFAAKPQPGDASTLSRYHTFFILQGNTSGSVLTDQRIRADLDSALDARGWVDVPPSEAEAVVVAHAATATAHSYPAFYAGWGGWPWQATPGARTGQADDYKPGTLVVDIFDAQSKQALWSGAAVGAAAENPDRSGRATDGAVARMFRTFPAVEPAEGETPPPAPAAAGADDVPRIIFARAPAWLIRIDGEPLYRAIDDTGLERVVNARPFIVRDTGGIHYLKIADGWMQAYSLTGMWSVSGTVPQAAAAALARAGAAGTVDSLAGGTLGPPPDRPQPARAVVPTVIVSTTPAALIVTDDEPQFAPRGGTSLLYMTNTTANVFREPTDQELYAAVSGGWYRAWSTAGPWQHVADADLPADLTGAAGVE